MPLSTQPFFITVNSSVHFLLPAFEQPGGLVTPGDGRFTTNIFNLYVEMVEQGGEPLLLSFLCCFAHTVQPLGHALPPLCRVHVRLNDVLLRLCPSLPQPPRKVALPCSVGSQVVRHSPTSPARACPPFGLWPSRTGLVLQTKACWRSPGSRACCFSACVGSQTTQDRQSTRVYRGCRVAFLLLGMKSAS